MLVLCMFAPHKALRGLLPLVALVAALALLAVRPCAVSAADEKEKPPEPQDITLKTSDGLTLAATYYPSNLGKDAVPVILLHAYKGSRTDLRELALALQGDAHAVLAADLRGHGASTPLNRELRAEDLAAISAPRGDLDKLKTFLFDRNNAGELNIEKLCVVGVEMGATVALRWTATDWNWEPLRTFKQGQDVKALVLISPEWTFRGSRINEAVAHPNVSKDISVLIVAGRRSSRFLQEATRLHHAFAKYHPTPPREQAEEKQTLWLKTPSTSLQGTQLLNEKSFQIDDMILEFIDLRLVSQAFPWTERKHPFE